MITHAINVHGSVTLGTHKHVASYANGTPEQMMLKFLIVKTVQRGRTYERARLEGFAMAENKMEQVAAMFGKKLGERFTIRHIDDNFKCDVIFTDYGFSVYGLDDRYVDTSVYYLEGLLAGFYEIVEG